MHDIIIWFYISAVLKRSTFLLDRKKQKRHFEGCSVLIGIHLSVHIHGPQNMLLVILVTHVNFLNFNIMPVLPFVTNI